MTLLTTRLEALSGRVNQILKYHFIDAAKVDSREVIAHFTNWDACTAMFATARDNRTRGLTLWAGDADCLNDPLDLGGHLKTGHTWTGQNRP
jgi:hypothetical protein